MMLIRFQIWSWYGFSFDSWCGSKPWFEANPSEPYPSCIKTISKSYQNCIKIISKPQKQSRHRPKGCPGTVSVSFLEANPSGTLKKALRSQTLSKPCKNHIQNILKPYLNNMPYPNRFISSNRIKNHIKIGKKNWIGHPRGIPGFITLWWKRGIILSKLETNFIPTVKARVIPVLSTEKNHYRMDYPIEITSDN